MAGRSLGEVDIELIERYSTRAPRYTSYPTAVEFSPAFGNAEWRTAFREAFAARPRDRRIALYFHIPFCRELCYFCACNKIIAKNRSDVAPYLAALEREIRSYQELMGEAPIVGQLHWGGGSPNFLDPAEIAQLHECTRAVFPKIAEDADVSIELDPRTTTIAQLRTLREIGFNRISLGVQDFNEAVQKAVHRVQSYEDTAELCAEGRRLGFSGVNVDLIYGLPLQTPASFGETLEKICGLRPDRIALYGYAHVTWIRKVQKVFEKTGLPSPRERIELFLSALNRLCAEGYEYIGMDHFALPNDALSRAREDGTLHRNFMGYTTHKTDVLLGFGMSAISSIPGAYAQNEKELPQYRQRIEAEGLAIERGLRRSQEDQIRGAIIQALLCDGKLDFNTFQREHGVEIMGRYGEAVGELAALRDDGLVTVTDNQITVTESGRLFSRNIASVFDAYLPLHQKSSQPVFSQAV